MKVELLAVVYRTRVRRRVLETVALLVVNMLGLMVILRAVAPARTPSLDPAHNPALDYALDHALDFTLDPTPSPLCQANLSAWAEPGFDSFPRSIQDMLLFRHCRHFPLLLNAPRKCHAPSRPVFLLAIKSAPGNYERRQVLRETWASERLQAGMHVRTVFLTGTAGAGFERRRLDTLLRLESRAHRDILQWDFHDSFCNLTLKQVLFMDWLERWCPVASFLFNGDDDVFANTDNMAEYLRLLQDAEGAAHLFVGQLMVGSTPIRDNASKYYVPELIEPGSVYPPYCSGGGYLYSRATAAAIRRASTSVALIPIDDAYMGMCLREAGLKPNPHAGVWADGLRIPSTRLDAFDPCHYRELILVHKFLPHQIFIIWHEIHRRDLKCARKVSHV